MAEDMDSLKRKVFHANSNSFHNLDRLIDYERSHGNQSGIGEFQQLLLRLKDMGADRISKPVRMKRMSHKVAEKGERPYISHLTGHSLRFVNSADFDFPRRNPTHSKKDHVNMSNKSYAFFRTLFEALPINTARFESRFTPKGERDKIISAKRDIEEIITMGFSALPVRLRKKLDSLIDSDGIRAVAEMLRYAPELRRGNLEEINYKKISGNLINRTYNFLVENDNIDAPEAFIALERIKKPYLQSTKADWLIAAALAAQVLPEKIEAVFGREKSDIEYVAKNGRSVKDNCTSSVSTSTDLFIDLDTIVKPVHWYREIKPIEDAMTLREMLDKKQITRAMAEGAKRATAGFWNARNNYARSLIAGFMSEHELSMAADGLWNIYAEDKKRYASAKKDSKKADLVLAKRSYKILEKFFETIEYKWYEKEGRERKGTISDWINRMLSLSEIKDLMGQFSAEWGKLKYSLTKEDEDERMAILGTEFVYIKKDDEIYSLAEKVAGSYFADTGNATPVEKNRLKSVNISNKRFHRIQNTAAKILQLREFGIIESKDMKLIGESKTENSFDLACRVIEDYKIAGEDDKQKINFLLKLNTLYLDTSDIRAMDGKKRNKKSDRPFNIETLANSEFISPEQSLIINALYHILHNEEELAAIDDDSAYADAFKRYKALSDFEERCTNPRLVLYSNSSKDSSMLMPAMVHFITPPHKIIRTKDRSKKSTIRISVADLNRLDEFQDEKRMPDDYTPAADIPFLQDKLKIITSNKSVEYMKEHRIIPAGYSITNLKDVIGEIGISKIMLNTTLIEAIDIAYQKCSTL
jgi:hypothetical protein